MEHAAIKYSIVVPVYNEEKNIDELIERLQKVVLTMDSRMELVLVNDGSKDTTFEHLTNAYMKHDNILVINLARNYGQTYALAAGFENARGDIVISMDGDLQHNPEELPFFVQKIAEGYDLVSGWRKERKDNFFTRRIPSKIANWLISIISGVKIHDFGTTFKAYRKEILSDIKLYGEQHRFIPALALLIGARITEIPISNVVRQKGKSKYGIDRTLKVILDLIMLRFLLKYSTKPLYFFGLPGLILSFVGYLISIFLLAKKVFMNIHILSQHGPLMLLSILLIIMGSQFISLGILAEMISRMYYEFQNKRPYVIKNILIK